MSERAGEVECTCEEERDRDLNDVGPKTVETSSTGQTGCSDRSDRSGPGCQEKFLFSDLSRELELMTEINFNYR